MCDDSTFIHNCLFFFLLSYKRFSLSILCKLLTLKWFAAKAANIIIHGFVLFKIENVAMTLKYDSVSPRRFEQNLAESFFRPEGLTCYCH